MICQHFLTLLVEKFSNFLKISTNFILVFKNLKINLQKLFINFIFIENSRKIIILTTFSISLKKINFELFLQKFFQKYNFFLMLFVTIFSSNFSKKILKICLYIKIYFLENFVINFDSIQIFQIFANFYEIKKNIF